MERLKKLIDKLVPESQTNIFRMLINGFDAGLDSIDNNLKTFKRDRNILETNNIKALRSLTAENGFEPSLLIPAKGLVNINISAGYFNENGNEIYLPPYTQFQCKSNGLTYYYDSNVPLKLNLNQTVPLTEGLNVSENIDLNLFNDEINSEICKVYISNGNISDKSIKLKVNGVSYQETKSLINKFNDKVFIVKYSNSIDYPIVIYIANGDDSIEISSIVNVEYKLCNGINGIVDDNATFETDGLVNLNNQQIGFNNNLVNIVVSSGFNFAGSGTHVDTMKSQIGYNHNIGIIFDTNSYKEFIGMYSNVLLNKIKLHNDNKSINDIYVSRKTFALNLDEYQEIINKSKYKFSNNELNSFSEIITENEYCLSNHNLYNIDTVKYAFQIEFNNSSDFIYKEQLKEMIYSHFIKFLKEKNHSFDVSFEMKKFMDNNRIVFKYIMFNSDTEGDKIKNKINFKTEYIISNNNKLPILFGNFNIADLNYSAVKLFFNINFIQTT